MSTKEWNYDESVTKIHNCYTGTWKKVSEELLNELATAKEHLNKGPGNPGDRYTWKQYVTDAFNGEITQRTIDNWLKRRQIEAEAWMALFKDLKNPPPDNRNKKPPKACHDILISTYDDDKRIKITFSLPEYPEELFEETIDISNIEKIPHSKQVDPMIDKIKSRIEVPDRDLLDGKKFTYGTEFSGYGGSSIGLRDAGGRGLFAIERDPKVCEVFKDNFKDEYPEDCIFQADIMDVSGEQLLQKTGLKIGQLDFFQSSAPCQSFSRSNTKKTNKDGTHYDKLHDEKNFLFYKSIEHVEALLPRIVVFENVAGMITGNNRVIFLDIVRKLTDVGYNVKTWLLHASDYGAPQTRPRTWIIGIRKDLRVEPSIPAPLGEPIELNNRWYGIPGVLGHQKGQFDRNFIVSDFPCSTITRTAGFNIVDENGVRRPEPEEVALLSTFPKDFKRSGNYIRDHAGFGNAVLPLMMQVLAEYLIPLANGEKPKGLMPTLQKINARVASDEAHWYNLRRITSNQSGDAN